MKKLIVFILTVSMVVGIITAFEMIINAEDIISGNWTYSLDNNNNATIKGTNLLGAIAVPSSIDGYTVTAIGAFAFRGYMDLISISLPDSVTTVGNDAFSGCTNLSNVILSKGLISLGGSAFYGCSSLKQIEIPKSLTTATNDSWGPFTNSGLITVTFETGTTKIPDRLFSSCQNLESIIIPDTITSIGSLSFHSCISMESIIIPNSVTVIGSEAFYGCKNLSNVVLSKGLVTLGGSAFNGCASLEQIEIPKSLTTATNDSWGPFTNSGLITATFEAGTTKIPDRLFQSCQNLKTITIPDTITSIGSLGFYGCTALSNIYFHGNAPTFGSSALPNLSTITGYYPINATGWEPVIAAYNQINWLTWDAPDMPYSISIANHNYNSSTKLMSAGISVTNNTDLTGKVKVIVAVYSNVNQMLTVKTQDIDFDSKESKTIPFSETVNNLTEQYTIKVFVWSADNSMVPLARPRIVNIP